jgi:membrane peptidoglycan carboxypeptidase
LVQKTNLWLNGLHDIFVDILRAGTRPLDRNGYNVDTEIREELRIKTQQAVKSQNDHEDHEEVRGCMVPYEKPYDPSPARLRSGF